MAPLTMQPQDLDPAAVEAVDWIVCLSSGEATEDDVRAFETWRAAQPGHEAAFRALAGTRMVGRALIAQPTVSRRAMLAGSGTALTVIAAVGLARPPLGLWPSFAELLADHRTAPGQRFAFHPVAGVDVELNSRTSVALLSGGEGLRLIDGESFVAIQRDRPFELEADGARFVATAAAFNIQTLAGGLRLTCLQGDVTCIGGGHTARIRQDSEWRLTATGATTVRAVDPASASSWRQGILRFANTPLDEVIEQFNRYRSVAITLTDKSLGGRPVSGVFYTGEIDSAILLLQQLLNLRVRNLPGNVVLIS